MSSLRRFYCNFSGFKISNFTHHNHFWILPQEGSQRGGHSALRLDRLEQSGHIERRPDPGDRRGVLVGLTPAGRELIDAAVEGHVANEVSLLSVLDHDERAALDQALRRLVGALEKS